MTWPTSRGLQHLSQSQSILGWGLMGTRITPQGSPDHDTGHWKDVGHLPNWRPSSSSKRAQQVGKFSLVQGCLPRHMQTAAEGPRENCWLPEGSPGEGQCWHTSRGRPVGCWAQGLPLMRRLKARRLGPRPPQVSSHQDNRPRTERGPHLSNLFSSRTFFHCKTRYREQMRGCPVAEAGGVGGAGNPALPSQRLAVGHDLQTPHLGL